MSTPPPPPSAYPGPTPMSPEDQRLWATLTHIGGIVVGWIAPLVGYLLLKDRGAFIAEHTKAALNFQLTMLIAYVISGILLLVVVGFLLFIAVAVVVIVFSIIAAMKANAGELYQYPLTIRFIK